MCNIEFASIPGKEGTVLGKSSSGQKVCGLRNQMAHKFGGK